MKSRTEELEAFLEIEATIIEHEDAISGMTKEVDEFLKQKDEEKKKVYDEGNIKLAELDAQKQAIVDDGNAKIDLIEKERKDAIEQLNEKIKPIYDSLTNVVYPMKNDLFLSLNGIPKVILPENSKVVN